MTTGRSQSSKQPRATAGAGSTRPAARSAAPRGAVNPGGRPPKFDEPSRPVTLTLPLSTLRALERIDEDRARAIVKLTETAVGGEERIPRPVEIVEMLVGHGLLVVGESRALKRIPFLHMVEVAPGRFLLALDSGHDFRALELAIRDVLEDLPVKQTQEILLLTTLLSQIGKLRKSGRVKMAEILFVKLDRKARQ